MEQSQSRVLHQVGGPDLGEHDHAWRTCKRPIDGEDTCYCCDLCSAEFPPA